MRVSHTLTWFIWAIFPWGLGNPQHMMRVSHTLTWFIWVIFLWGLGNPQHMMRVSHTLTWFIWVIFLWGLGNPQHMMRVSHTLTWFVFPSQNEGFESTWGLYWHEGFNSTWELYWLGVLSEHEGYIDLRVKYSLTWGFWVNMRVILNWG
jgi:hypothetical protein